MITRHLLVLLHPQRGEGYPWRVFLLLFPEVLLRSWIDALIVRGVLQLDHSDDSGLDIAGKSAQTWIRWIWRELELSA